MDISDITQTPTSTPDQPAPPPQAPVAPETQKKPYWQVLDSYNQFKAKNPDFADMSMPEFAQRSNNVTKSNQFDEGLNDSGLRHLGGNIGIGLHRFGGESTGWLGPGVDKALGLNQFPTLSQVFGGPREGIDLPEAAKRGTEAIARRYGVGPGLSSALGTGASQFVESVPAMAAGVALGPPGLAGVSALQTYGETGSKLQATVSGTGAALIPKFMEGAGQLALRTLGAKTVGELSPELANLLPKDTPATVARLAKFAPSGLLQRGAEFGAKQLGLTANLLETQAGVTATDPSMTWQDKLKNIGSEFAPSNLLATAIGQLPFTGMDLIHGARTSPLDIERQNVKAEFAGDFTKAYQEAPSNVKKEPPPASVIQHTIDRLVTGKAIPPDSTVGKVLESMGQAPVQMDLKTPIRTSEGDMQPIEAVESVRLKANQMLTAQGLADPDNPPITQAHDPTLAFVLRGIDSKTLSKDDTIHLAASKVTDMWAGDREALKQSGYVPEAEFPAFGQGTTPDRRFASYQMQSGVDEKLAALTDPESKLYDQNMDQRAALAFGDQEHWERAGIPQGLMKQTWEAVRQAASEVAPELQVTKEASTEKPMLTNIVNLVSGLGPKRAERIAAIQQQIQDFIGQHGIFDVQNGEGVLHDRLQRLYGEIQRIYASKWERAGMTTYSQSGETAMTQNVGAPLGDATFAARRRILTYDKPFDINDPKSVADFVRDISATIRQAEKNYTRRQLGEPAVKGPDGRSLRFPTKALAEEWANDANSKRGRNEFNVKYAVPEAPEADGTFRVLEKRFASLFGSEAVGGFERSTEAGLQGVAERLAEAEEDTTEKHLSEEGVIPHGTTFDALSETANMFGKRVTDLSKQNDPAVVEGRIAAMVKNFSDFLQTVPEATFREIWKAGTGKSVRDIDTWKKRFIRYVQFLGYHGDVNIEQNEGRLRGVGDLAGMNKFMAELGKGKYSAGHKRAGEEQADQWNVREQGTNFFEKFALVSNYASKFMLDPRTMLPDPEHRPIGDYGWQTPEFRRDLPNKVDVNWADIPKSDVTHFRPGVLNRDGSEYRSDLAGITDKPGTIKVNTGQPLADLLITAAQHDLVVKAKDMVKWFKQLGGVDTTTIEEVMRRLPFVANQNVGVGMTKDFLNRGYFHTDEALSSGGVLIDPFMPNDKGRLDLMHPKDIFPILMEELGHSSVDFAYNTDLPFKSDVDRAYTYVKGRLDDLVGLGAAGEKFAQLGMTSLRNPREMLAGMFKDPALHEFLKGIDDPEPFYQSGVQRSFFDKLYNMIKDLFTRMIGPVGAETMLARVAGLVSRGVEIQRGMPLVNRGDVYQFLYDRGYLAGEPIISTPRPQPIPKGQEPTGVFAPRRVELERQRQDLQSQLAAAETDLFNASQHFPKNPEYLARYTHRVNTLKEGLRQVEEEGQARGEPYVAPQEPGTLPKDLKPVKSMLLEDVEYARRRLHAIQQGTATFPENELQIAESNLRDAFDRVEAYDRGELRPADLVDSTVVKDRESYVADLQAQLAHTQGMQLTDPAAQAQQAETIQRLTGDIQRNNALIEQLRKLQELKPGQVLESRMVPAEREDVEVPKPMMYLHGAKRTLLKDPVVNGIVSGFVQGSNVKDAFAGAGHLSQFAKTAGANHVSINVFNPRMQQVYNAIKTDPVGFGQRVERVVSRISSPRNQTPTMKDGSDLGTYLNQVEQQDPNVGLFVKQNFSRLGREVATDTAKFTPGLNFTDTGLQDLPRRIQEFANQVDQVSHGNGWDVVANAQQGDHVMVDPPYTGVKRYGGEPAGAEARVSEYEKYMYPAAQRGASFLVFDLADPKLMESLMQHGFTVLPVQRAGRGGKVVKEELVAYNGRGQVLESRTDPSRVFDAMKEASLYLTEDNKGDLWFKPNNVGYFQRTFGGVFGNKLRFTEVGGQWGYSLRPSDAFNVTQADVARMPMPRIKPWAPSAFETLRGMFKQQGANDATAEAQAGNMLRFSSLLKGSEGILWGQLPSRVSKTGDITLGLAWGYDKHVGLMPESVAPEFAPPQHWIQHESTHGSGFNNQYKREPLDVRLAINEVNQQYSAMDLNERGAMMTSFVNTTNFDYKSSAQVYAASLLNPLEFAGEVMGHVGDIISNVPKPSAYLREMMRFAPDEISNMLQLSTLRRTQGLDRLQYILEHTALSRGVKNNLFEKVKEIASVFKDMSRPALEIAEDISEFYRMRMVYPDTYKGFLQAWAEKQAAFSQAEGQPTPSMQGVVLESRLPPQIENFIRKFFRYPTSDGNLPIKLPLWDRNMMQFPQFALKYPMARSAVDMLGQAEADRNTFRRVQQVALAGAFEGNKLMDDVRTKHVADFYASTPMRSKLSKIALELNVLGDFNYNQEKKAVGGDEFAMDPAKVTGWLTPQYIQSLMTKHGVTDAERPAIQTVLDGLRNQYNATNLAIRDDHVHSLETLLARGVARAANLQPEAARGVAKLLSEAIQTQAIDPQGSAQKLAQFQQQIVDPTKPATQAVYQRMLTIAQDGWTAIRRLERAMDMRSPYYFSEIRPGKFGLIWEDAKGKTTNRYFASDKDRAAYVTNNKIIPVRTTNPGEGIGISPNIMSMIDEIHQQTVEQAKNLFGETEAEQLGKVVDFSTELRDSLNRNDLLKESLGRRLHPGREELDMFDVTQHYLNAVSNAIKQRFISREKELLFTSPDFNNEPEIKQYVERQIQAMLQPDTPTGSFLRNIGFFYYLWGNPSSMIMQTSHQIMGLAPMLTRQGQSVSGSFNTIRKANLAVIEARKGGFKDPVIRDMVARLEQEGGVSSWLNKEIDYNKDLSLVNRIRGTSGQSLWQPFDLAKNKLYQAIDLGRRLYSIIPDYNTKVGFVAALMHLMDRAPEFGGSLSGEELYKEARFMQQNTMYTGGKAGRPGFFQWMPRSAAQGLWSLQTYANGLTTEMGELIRRSFNPKGMTPAQTKQVRKAAAQMLITQTAVSGVLGLPFATLVLTGLQKLFPDLNIEESIREGLASLAGDDKAMGGFLSNAATTGIPSALDYSPDLGSRFALHGVLHVSPYGDIGWEQLFGPAGGVLTNALKGAQAGLEGRPLDTVQSMMPVGFQRVWQSLEQGQTYKTQSGRIMANDLGPGEVVARMIGFRPARVRRAQDFERLNKITETAEAAQQSNWTRKQTELLKQNRDTEVRQNIAQRVADKKGVYSAQRLADDVAKEYEEQNLPVDLKKFGNRATVESQKALQGVLGAQAEGPSNAERLLMQQQIAQRLGWRGPSRARWHHAAGVDQLLQMYPHLTTPQASLLLTHAIGSRPSAELYQELTTGGE